LQKVHCNRLMKIKKTLIAVFGILALTCEKHCFAQRIEMFGCTLQPAKVRTVKENGETFGCYTFPKEFEQKASLKDYLSRVKGNNGCYIKICLTTPMPYVYVCKDSYQPIGSGCKLKELNYDEKQLLMLDEGFNPPSELLVVYEGQLRLAANRWRPGSKFFDLGSNFKDETFSFHSLSSYGIQLPQPFELKLFSKNALLALISDNEVFENGEYDPQNYNHYITVVDGSNPRRIRVVIIKMDNLMWLQIRKKAMELAAQFNF
jgi:hypothetical protein